MSKHAELPYSTSFDTVVDSEGYFVATTDNDTEDAEFIVKACNNHYQLLEAVRIAEALIRDSELGNCTLYTNRINEFRQAIKDAS